MPEVMNQPGQLATSSIPETEIRVVGRLIVIRRRGFMLVRPEPATPIPEDAADVRIARQALAEGDRKPYEQVRRDLDIG